MSEWADHVIRMFNRNKHRAAGAGERSRAPDWMLGILSMISVSTAPYTTHYGLAKALHIFERFPGAFTHTCTHIYICVCFWVRW